MDTISVFLKYECQIHSLYQIDLSSGFAHLLMEPGTVQTHAGSVKGLIVISLILSLGSLVLAFCLTVTEDYVGIPKSPEHRLILCSFSEGTKTNSWTSESTHPPWKHILDRLTGSSRSPRVPFLVVFEETEAVPHSHKPSLLAVKPILAFSCWY